MSNDIRFYSLLSRVKWLRSYSSKFLLIIFAGFLLPVLSLAAFHLFFPGREFSEAAMLYVLLVSTLVSLFVSCILVKRLLDPVRLMRESLCRFLAEHKVPDLPTAYTDEIGLLMKDIQDVIAQLNFLTETKNDVIELISHDLRSPASSMLGLVEVLETTRGNDKDLMVYCDKLKRLVSKQLMLTNDILTSLKQEEKMMDITRKRMYVAPMILSAVKVFETAIQQKNLTVDIDAPSYLGIYGDEMQLREVIGNLIHNAVKFSHRNGKITISAAMENDMVKISVTDTGMGMEDVNPDMLFKRFTRYSRPGTYGEESSGLGLFICKKIIEKHGGYITVTSEGINKGTTFNTYLPA
jgi:signal transduction histidine kinase